MYRTSPPDCTEDLRVAKEKLCLNGTKPKIGIILGTGWNDCISRDETKRCPLSCLPSFKNMCELKGHSRELVYAKIANEDVLLLNGRVHLNESPCDPAIYTMVRVQTELLCLMGCEFLIITNAAGRLNPCWNVGDVMAAQSFFSLNAPPMPLWAGEFCSPDAAIDQNLVDVFRREIAPKADITSHKGRYAMVRGPWFEGLEDKKYLQQNADVVGMSTLPEACIAAIFGVKILPLSFISNAEDEHSHEQNIARATEAKPKLGKLLEEVVKVIAQE